MINSEFVFSCEEDLLAYIRNEWAKAVIELDIQISDEEVRQGYRKIHGLLPDVVITAEQVAQRRDEVRQIAFDYVCEAIFPHKEKEAKDRCGERHCQSNARAVTVDFAACCT